MQQLGLALRLPQTQTFANFIPGRNAEAIAALRDWASGQGAAVGQGAPYLALHGEAGSGKTHLLRAACAELQASGQSVTYLSLKQSDLEPAICEGLETLSAVVLDDVHAVAGDAGWERALFALFNRLREREARLLIAASRPPAALSIDLADLHSRLCSGPGFLLQPLDDDGLDRLLKQGAQDRGFALDAAARRYLLTRCTRDPAKLLALLDDIDAASLAQARAPTVPFLSALLASRETC
ncbi:MULTISPECIES: DnaA regulatory inactivator Hda [Thiorhodovibrio]|uniref:DnaA regulatory inactivator Hda n=1 Tax=Thiorhodovibrio TaxID=61593 RepID=UPI0019129775|nr:MULTISPECIES: DnaA regulatory inactivator Hda [Thiorhodovibrio]MBK5967281.1 DnaA regulatory inactivator Hda [Thiorhodovibrio winogradskyi]WPL14466.1 DnaA regulatory inactivator Hda [Thiorhodovibrio litoralis]